MEGRGRKGSDAFHTCATGAVDFFASRLPRLCFMKSSKSLEKLWQNHPFEPGWVRTLPFSEKSTHPLLRLHRGVMDGTNALQREGKSCVLYATYVSFTSKCNSTIRSPFVLRLSYVRPISARSCRHTFIFCFRPLGVAATPVRSFSR